MLPHPIAGHVDHSAAARRGFAAWLQQTVCGVGGHEVLLHFERDRLFLECVNCGHQTPGWQIAASRPAARRA